MPIRKNLKKKTTKKRAPVRRRRVARVPRRRNFNQPEWASCTEVIRGQVLQTNTMYGPSLLQLADFERATVVSQAYQEFRITGIKYRFTPRFDTFPANTDAATALSVPYLYYMIDRTGAIKPTPTLGMLQSMGAKPHRFDDKTVSVSYRPGVLQQVEAGLTVGGSVLTRPLISPWLSTQRDTGAGNVTSTVDHRGLWLYLDAKALPGDGAYEFDVDIEVNFQFRKPLLPFANNVDAAPAYGGSIIPARPTVTITSTLSG